jgi:hypothetical protein
LELMLAIPAAGLPVVHWYDCVSVLSFLLCGCCSLP